MPMGGQYLSVNPQSCVWLSTEKPPQAGGIVSFLVQGLLLDACEVNGLLMDKLVERAQLARRAGQVAKLFTRDIELTAGLTK